MLIYITCARTCTCTFTCIDIDIDTHTGTGIDTDLAIDIDDGTDRHRRAQEYTHKDTYTDTRVHLCCVHM